MNIELKIAIVTSIFALIASVTGAVLVYLSRKQDRTSNERTNEATNESTIAATVAGQMTGYMTELRADALSKSERISDLETRLDLTIVELRELRDQYLELKVRYDTLSHDLAIIESGINAMPAPFWCKDQDKRFVIANTAWLQMMNLTLEQIQNKTAQEMAAEGIIPQELADDWDAGDDEALISIGHRIYKDERAIDANGEVTPGRSCKLAQKAPTARQHQRHTQRTILIWGTWVSYKEWGIPVPQPMELQ